MAVGCYPSPRYWDLAFSDETLFEADFVEAIAKLHLHKSTGSILEIGCGGGRQIVELARRGWSVTGIDLEPGCVKFASQQVRRAGLSASVQIADMTDFDVGQQFEVAHCLVNTFRHLTSEAAARNHLLSVASALKPGGLYLLGFHLLPPDALELDCERWSLTKGSTRVTTTVRVQDFNRRTRIEVVRFSLKVTVRGRVLRFRSDHKLRIYRADQFLSLLRSVPQLELIGTYDFCYDIQQPRGLNDELGDAVFVLRRVTSRT